MTGSDKINDLIDEAIDSLSSDNINEGAESLIELAYMWAKAGFPKQTFMEVRQYIIREAEDRTDAYFIKEKLQLVEQQLQKVRLYPQ